MMPTAYPNIPAQIMALARSSQNYARFSYWSGFFRCWFYLWNDLAGHISRLAWHIQIRTRIGWK
jgi:hypothetical protein